MPKNRIYTVHGKDLTEDEFREVPSRDEYFCDRCQLEINEKEGMLIISTSSGSMLKDKDRFNQIYTVHPWYLHLYCIPEWMQKTFYPQEYFTPGGG